MWTPDHSIIVTAEKREVEAWASLRSQRDARLAATDFTQLPDYPSDPLPWQEYRQALRDLPQNTTDPLNPAWPDEPI